MGGTPIQVDVLPTQVTQFPLAHGGLQGQLHQGQQPAIARLTAGPQQAGFFPGLQAPVASSATGGQFDVAHRIVGIDAPFLAGDLEDMAEQDQVPFDVRRRRLVSGSAPFLSGVTSSR